MNPTNHSETIVALQDQIQARKGLLACACEYTVALHSSGRAVYVGANSFGQQEITTPEGVSSLACASEYLLALMEDGTVFAAGSCAAGASLKDLTNVRVIHCSDTHWAALLRNNHVVIGTETGYTQGDSTEWPDVFDLVCGRGFTAGITREGRVIAVGGGRVFRHVLNGWRDVVGIFTDVRGDTLMGILVMALASACST